MDMKKNSFQTLTVMAAISLMLISCDKKEEKGTAQAPISVKEMIVGDVTSSTHDFNYSGTVEEETGTALSFSAAGTIKQLNVKVGDRVRKGQLIASIDPTTVKNSYEMAHTNKLQAQDAYQRYKQLHDKGSLPEIRWVEVQSQLQEAISAENIARKNLGDCNLYAPYDGIISEKDAEVSQNIAPGIPVAKLVTTKVLNVKISVPESEMAKVSIHQHAMIRVQALGGRTFSGYVTEKSVIADPVSRSYDVKIRVENANKDLLPGMVSEVSLVQSSTTSNQQANGDNQQVNSSAIIIPAPLIQLDDDNSNFVWLDEGGKAVRRTIVCGDYQSNGVEIKSGLKPGDRLITEGQQKVCNGTPIKVKQN